MTARIALISTVEAIPLDDDLPPLRAALSAHGAAAEIVPWDAEVDWSGFDAAVIRSTWDYPRRRAEFLARLAAIERTTPLWNPMAVAAWNTDKRYLRELAAAGVPVVPTTWLEPGGAVALPVAEEIVVKPVISAGARDTIRVSLANRDEAWRHTRALLEAGRHVMVQPYLQGVDTVGERGIVYIEGAFSHAFTKGPLLVPDRPAPDVLFVREEIRPATPTADERAIAAAAVRAAEARFGSMLYARVDLVPAGDGRPLVIEIELVEPSMFHEVAPESADRFAAAVLGRVRTDPRGRRPAR